MDDECVGCGRGWGGGVKRVLGGQDKLERSGAFLLLLNVQALKEVVWNQHGYFTGTTPGLQIGYKWFR